MFEKKHIFWTCTVITLLKKLKHCLPNLTIFLAQRCLWQRRWKYFFEYLREVETKFEYIFFSYIFFGIFVYTEYLCRPSEASTQYCVIPGGYPPQGWQSLLCAGEELVLNPGLLICSQEPRTTDLQSEFEYSYDVNLESIWGRFTRKNRDRKSRATVHLSSL